MKGSPEFNIFTIQNHFDMRLFYLLTTLFIFSSQLISQKEITLEDIFKNGTFRTQGVPGFNFMQDGRHYTALSDNRIVQYDLTTGKMVEVLLDARQIADDYKIENYEFAFDERYIVLRSKTNRIYRRSYTAEYVVYDRKKERIRPINNLNQISYATVDPSGQRVAFVKDNDLYYQHLASKKVMRVTSDGEKNKIINGHTDWVYEEEFGFVKAFEWSVKGDKLAFIRFDESEVEEFTMTLHHNLPYPEYETFKYPKVGEKNSNVSVHIHHLKNGETADANIGDMTDMYIPRITWSANNDEVCIFKMNRHQNHLQVYKTDGKTGQSSVMLDETNDYYIDIHDNLTFINDGKQFLWTSEKDGYNHFYLYNVDGTLSHQITKGAWEVTSAYGYDESKKEIIYQSTENSSVERGIYAMSLDGQSKREIATQKGHNHAQFSSTFDYFILTHSDHATPPSVNVYDRNGELVRPLEDNATLKGQMKEYGAEPVELTTIEVENGIELNASIIKPKDFDPNKKYPLFMYLYGGPGSQQVMDRWNSFRYYWWFQLLADQGYVVAVVDNRGTGGKGEQFKKMTYLQLGKYETIDQINAAKHFAKMDFIDESRIGIFGWSYGGFMSTLCLLKGNDTFKTAIAVAPVTSWKWYDSIYTERYMRTVEENEEGYYDNSPVNFADRLKGNYLLVHGLADDNVHFQNTAEMANALIGHNKQFDTYFYPNRNHGIYGDNARLHLFTKMTNFVKEKL